MRCLLAYSTTLTLFLEPKAVIAQDEELKKRNVGKVDYRKAIVSENKLQPSTVETHDAEAKENTEQKQIDTHNSQRIEDDIKTFVREF